MNHLNKFKQFLAICTLAAVLLPGIAGLLAYIGLSELTSINDSAAVVLAGAAYLVVALLAFLSLLRISIQPTENVWQAIWHVSPGKSSAPPPNPDNIRFGRELVSAMVSQVYELASTSPLGQDSEQHNKPNNKTDEGQLLESIPLSLFVLSKDMSIKYANSTAGSYIEQAKEELIGKNIYDVLHLSFSSEDTLDSWLKSATKSRAIDTRTWEHVKHNIDNKNTRQFDLAAFYSKDNSAGNEVVLALFDKANAYTVQEQATSYVAMAVHELRTPLTMLRGYIELFEEELGEQLSPEHKEFMRKMSASAQNLTAFVSNILNVSRINENQFELTLNEDDWNQVLSEIIQDMELRAQVKGKRLILNIEPNLPAVGLDKISMHEVVGNLVDNAIKYSGQSTDIEISAKVGKDGYVETTVKDFGDGMPENVIGGLFTKYYRSHRSKNAVGGSGLGLYLVKSIVTAHGGSVWVQSKEGEGSTFGFSLVPFSQIKDKGKSSGEDGIKRQASGWIKNHSLYRR